MKTKMDIGATRALWLATVKTIASKCFECESRLSDLCPQRYSDDERKTRLTSLREIAKLSKEIGDQVKKLNHLEQGGGIGFSVILGRQPEELTAVVLALLVTARLDSDASRQLRCVQDIINCSANRNPSVAFQVRNLFRSDSVLFPHIAIGRSHHLDTCTVGLLESAINRLLGQPADLMEVRCDAEVVAVAGRVVRG